MVMNATTTVRVSVQTPDGQIQESSFVPAEEVERLRAEVTALREQLAVVTAQRDHHLAKREEAERTLFPLPPTEEEMADPSLWATSEDIQRMIADLESR